MQSVLESSSSSDNNSPPQKHVGSIPGRAPNVICDYEGAQKKLVKQYFNGPDSQYSEEDFKQIYGIPHLVFNQIYEAIKDTPEF